MNANQGTMTQNRPGTTGTGTTGFGGSRPGGQQRDTGGTGVMDKARDAVSGAVDTAKDWAGNVADTAREWGSNVAESASEACSTAWDATRSAEQNLEAFIRRYPVQTLMFAFGAGCLVGMAMCRRD
jgi:ElaB/YqjD/DUF883 family membrane-anchored ribosome-binding protein